jgi:hypothetical protein
MVDSAYTDPTVGTRGAAVEARGAGHALQNSTP